MKKSLVITLALVFVLGIAGTAFAANPFVDVPAKHWAYDAVSKLAKAGIVDGYNDGTFRGDKTMTRYEMAQIVAKAMAKSEKADAENKALVDKLAVEFSAELDNLGVRVTKLEKKMGTLQWGGDARVRWNNANEGADTNTQDRLRLYMKADVNDNTQFNGKIMAKRHNDFGTTAKDDNRIAEASFTTKNFYGTTFVLGRQSIKLGATGYFLDTWGMADGAKLQFGNTVKVTAGYADFSPATKASLADSNKSNWVISEAAFANVDVKTSKATTLTGMYLNEMAGGQNDFEVYGAGFNSKLSDKWAVNADYVKNAAQNDATGYVGRIFYKGANKAVPHSWGLIAEYDNWENGSFVNWSDYANASLLPIHSGYNYNRVTKKYDVADSGNEFWGITAQYAPAKNIVLSAFQTLDVKGADKGEDKYKLTKFQVDFSF